MSALRTPAACILLMTLWCACRYPGREELRQAFVRGCYEENDSTIRDPGERQLYHAYCNCAGDRVLKGLSEQELKELNRLQQDGRSEQVRERLRPVLQPCLEELSRRMEGADTAGAIDSAQLQ